MNINTSPDAIVRSTAQLTPGYMSGFGNSFETEALPGAIRFALHRAARQQRAVVALSHPPVGEAFRAFCQSRCRAVAHRAVP